MAKRPASHIRRRKLVEEAVSRLSANQGNSNQDIAERLLEGLNPVQRAFVLDPNTQKAALCSRRAGKTRACMVNLVYTALTKPDSTGIYINTSRRECRNIMWMGSTGIKQLCAAYNINVRVNETYLELAFDNGSHIRLVGVDDADEMEKIRGDSYDLVIIDESAKVDSLRYFVEDIIFPALGDRMGTIACIGTPSVSCTGFFYDVTQENSSTLGWSTHTWTYEDNLALPHLTEYFESIKKKNGWGDDNDTWLREYRAKWVKSSELLVYGFNAIPESERYYDELPDILDEFGNVINTDWEYVLGVDLGYNDAFAYSIWAYNDHHPVAYEIESFKEQKLHEGEQADLVVELCTRFNFSAIPIDGSPATIEAWRERRGIPGKRAEKQHKHSYIKQLNSAMHQGKVKFRRGSPLATEMSVLQWKPNTVNSGYPKENKSKETPNDTCFVAGTLISTDRGLVSIEEVKPGDYAYTRKGLRVVSAAFSAGVKQIYRLTLENGTVLEGTANHPINTERGVVPLAELTSKDKVITWQESTVNQKELFIGERSLEGTQTLTPAVTGSTSSPRTVETYTALSAPFVSLSFSPRLLLQRFAAVSAGQRKEETVDLTMLPLNVSGVKRPIPEIDMPNPVVALSPVQRVTCTDRSERVFNITVEGEHEYFANGVSVLNCDASLYAWKELFNYAWSQVQSKTTEGTEEYYKNLEEQDEEYELRLLEQGDNHSSFYTMLAPKK